MAANAEEVRRGPGRPRKVQQVTKQEWIADDDEGDLKDDEGFSGLFGDDSRKDVIKVRVSRRDPNEGIVGYLEDPNLGEAEIKERWGGSTYLIQGINAKGQVIKNASIKIAGDPVFVSTAAEAQWRRARNLPMTAAGVAAGVEKNGMGFQEMLMFIQAQEQQRRQEEREHQSTLRKLELESEERRRRETTEAAVLARRDDEERERRRIKDDEDREARRRRDQAEAEQRQQQFMQQTIQMLQQSSNQALQFVKATSSETKPESASLMEAMKTVIAIKEAFAGEGGDGEETPINLLIKHGGEWINGLSTGIAGAVREIKQGGANGPSSVTPAAVAPIARSTGPSSPLALLPANHPLNEKVETLVAKLAAKGLDPIAAMDTIVTNVLNDVDKIPQQTTKPATEPVKPYVQGPVGVASATPAQAPPATAPSAEEKPKVIRLSFAR